MGDNLRRRRSIESIQAVPSRTLTHIENDEEHIRTDELLNNTRHSNTIYICIDPSKTNSKSKKCF